MTVAPTLSCTPRRRLRTKVSVGVTKPAAVKLKAPTDFRGRYEIKDRGDDYVVVRSALSDEQLSKLKEFLKKKRPREAKMKNEGTNSDDERKARYDDRDSKVSWFRSQAEIPWLHNAFVDVVREVGNAEWPILQTGLSGQLMCEFEDTQYAVYGEKQHFRAWHQDAFEEGNDPEDARQMTIVLMVSPKSDYTGGQLQAKVAGGRNGRKVIRSLDLDEGDMAVFPAKRLLHRVTEVKSGLRRTLVFWAFDRASCRHGRAAMGL
mmetsp:Transcript_12363/g.29035  ORF Transcript_12363/g.29035 Transcript_12363/m.29035 type:complete len:262 (-) Transcript_12363:23-808(-)